MSELALRKQCTQKALLRCHAVGYSVAGRCTKAKGALVWPASLTLIWLTFVSVEHELYSVRTFFYET
jgi:hypothetical protein